MRPFHRSFSVWQRRIFECEWMTGKYSKENLVFEKFDIMCVPYPMLVVTAMQLYRTDWSIHGAPNAKCNERKYHITKQHFWTPHSRPKMREALCGHCVLCWLTQNGAQRRHKYKLIPGEASFEMQYHKIISSNKITKLPFKCALCVCAVCVRACRIWNCEGSIWPFDDCKYASWKPQYCVCAVHLPINSQS